MAKYYNDDCETCQARRDQARMAAAKYQALNKDKCAKYQINHRAKKRHARLEAERKWALEKLEKTAQPEYRPEFIRIPPPRERCVWTGLGHDTIRDLIKPTRENNGKPLVESISLKGEGRRTGIRLVSLDSLLEYLWSRRETGLGDDDDQPKA